MVKNWLIPIFIIPIFVSNFVTYDEIIYLSTLVNDQKQMNIYIYYLEYNLNAINDMILKRKSERREKLISQFFKINFIS